MALIKSVRGFTPKVGKDCFLADNATLIGDTVIGDECSIWFGAILRGDVNSIRIGNRVNIQDGSYYIPYTKNPPSKSATTYPSDTTLPYTERPYTTEPS